MERYHVHGNIGACRKGVIKLVSRSDQYHAARYFRVSHPNATRRVADCRKELVLRNRIRPSIHVSRPVDALVHDGYFVMVDELCDAEDFSLEEVMRLAGAAEDAQTYKDIFVQLTTALRDCHDANVVFGNLKPSTVLLSSTTGCVKLVDFSFSDRCRDAQVGCYGARGSLAYMAPELWTRYEHGTAVDIWALGVVFYRVLSGGRYPFAFPRHATKSVILEQYDCPPDFAGIPAHVELIRWMLHQDPEQRPSAAEVLNALASGNA